MIKFDPNAQAFFHTLAEWREVDYSEATIDSFIGTATSSIIRPGTKNIIEAPEKSFKTTVLLRLLMGLAGGVTAYPSLPVLRPARVLYIHGEMTPQELAERRNSVEATLPTEALALAEHNFIDGRSVPAHLIRTVGQEEVRRWVKHYKPNVLALDPWQSFISGYDENEFKDVSQAMNFLDKLMVENNLTVFMPVHLGKDHSRGARGHSSLAGWRDTLIRLKKSGVDAVTCEVVPRWGEPIAPFKLTFRGGTMWENSGFRPQTMAIRKLLIHGPLTREEVMIKLGGKGEDTRKAIQRAIAEEAVVKHHKNPLMICLPWDPDE